MDLWKAFLDVKIEVVLDLHIVVGSVCGIFLVILSLSWLLEGSMNYAGKHVLITGGSSGIGLEIAKKYLALGSNISLVARNKGKLQKALTMLNGFKIRSDQKIEVQSVDVGQVKNETDVNNAIDELVHTLGPVYVLVNCAGTSIAGEFEGLEAREFQRMLDVNVIGSVLPTRAALKSMKANGQGGRIIFVASQVAQVAIHGYTAYAASKWALRGLAEALQMEVKPYGVLVSVVYPPDTDTPGYEEEMKSKPALTAALSESGSLFKPEEVAHDVVTFSGKGYSHISTGLDGWLLKMLHPGMGPANHIWETLQPILFAPLARIISLFYVLSWDAMCAAHVKNLKNLKAKSE